MTKAKPHTQAEQESADELRLFAENTASLYPRRCQIVGHSKRLLLANKPVHIRLMWRTWFTDAVHAYRREIGDEREGGNRFTQRVIHLAADQFAADERAKILNGEYDGQYGQPMLNPDGTPHADADRSFKEGEGEALDDCPVQWEARVCHDTKSDIWIGTGDSPTEALANAVALKEADQPG